MSYPAHKRHWFARIRQDCEAGQAIVELALTLPILVLLLLGAVEFGRFALLWIEITNAAKAAAQYGSQNSNYAADVAGMKAVAAQDAPDVTAQCTGFNTNVSGALPAATCSCVSAGVSSASSCSSTTCAGYLVQKLTVTTTATCTPLIYPTGFGGPITLTGNAVQEVLK
jgi:Flp pilus assembly protein TadG